MRRILLTFVALAALAPASPGLPSLCGAALAQSAAPGQDAPVNQMALTEDQVQNFLAAQADIDAIAAKMPADASEKPDPKVVAQLDAAAKKYKFANFAEFSLVAGNISLVVDGVDPKTKKYLGAEALLKQQIAAMQADAKMKPADKKAALAELNAELKSATPLKFPANADLVVKHIDAVMAAMQQDDSQGEPPKP